MYALDLLRRCLPIYLLTASLAFAGPALVVDHLDSVAVDSSLHLSEVIDLTLEKYPDTGWLKALEEEASAIQRRGDNWLAGPSSAGLFFQEASSGTLHYVDAHVQVHLWNLGQRDAEQRLAELAGDSAQSQAVAIKLKVAGLVRNALWDMALQSIRHDQAKAEVSIARQLLNQVKKLVDAGELPRSDYLLAQTELLQKKSSLTLAEAELMHARKRYISITQMNKVPADYQERLFELDVIQENHPALAAINNQIARKQGEINAIQKTGSGQTNLSMGINSDHGDQRSNKTESFNITVSIPFGGSDHLAPQIAAANVELNKLIAEREQLYRDLELAHHEAEHNLQVNKAELDIALELKQIAEDHLKMTELSFSVGEINLMDLLKIQSRTQQAVLSAKERSVTLQRDIALYNQAVGVLP